MPHGDASFEGQSALNLDFAYKCAPAAHHRSLSSPMRHVTPHRAQLPHTLTSAAPWLSLPPLALADPPPPHLLQCSKLPHTLPRPPHTHDRCPLPPCPAASG
jgi:hypothetical protein